MINILIKGLIYGIFSILPGLSGGVLALRLGDYDRLINIVNNKDFSIKNIIYIFLILIGFITGVVIFSGVVLSFYIKIKNIFIIIILLINLKLLIDQIKKVKIRIKKLITIMLLTILFFYIFHMINPAININKYTLFFIAGIVFSFTKIVPGVSGTSFLINISFYDRLLLFYSNPFKEFICNPLCWVIFIIISIISGTLFVRLIYEYSDLFNKLIIIILTINILDLLI